MTTAGPGPIIFSPSGLILNPNMPPGADPFLVTKALPQPVGELLGTGDLTFATPGPNGQLLVNLILGAAGAAAAVAILYTSLDQAVVSITLDASNRPSFSINVPGVGVVASWAPSGAALATGKPLSILLAWNSLVGTVTFTDAFGIPIAGAFAVAPSAPWVQPALTKGSVGYILGGVPAASNATIQKTQVSSR